MGKIRWSASVVIMVLMVASAGAGVITVEVPCGGVTVSADAEGYARFDGPGIRVTGATGQPALPYRTVTVLLPPAADLSSVNATFSGASWEDVPGRWDLRPMGAPATWDGARTVVLWPDDREIVDGRDVAAYASDSLFPPLPTGPVSSGSLRGWKVADVPVALYRYNPARKKLYRLASASLGVEFGQRERQAAFRPPASDRLASRRLGDRAVNFAEMSRLYETPARDDAGGGAGNGYVILTTSAIESALTNLDSFTINKEARGYTVTVVTEGTWGGGTGNTAAENIRSWIESNYLSMNIEYVLLIGDPSPNTGDLAMKVCYPYSGGCPTDYYFCDTTGNWDLDGDGRYGETGDFGAGGVDRNYDVAVGRIPCYGSTSEVDDYLAKVISYENTSAADAVWRENVLLPMVAFSGSCLMYELGEELKDDSISPKGWSYHRIYQSSYGLSPTPETIGNSYDTDTGVWNASPFGAVIWATHGWIDYAVSIMDTDHASTLNDGYPSIVYEGSCDNSYPEDSGNLAYALMRNGAITTVGATRTSWYTYPATSYKGTGTIGGVGYEYGYRLITDEMACGHALCDARQDVDYGPNWCWQNYIVFNVYGDPSLGLSTTLVDGDSDGMPDYWELTYFGDTTQDPGDDYDSDGLTNIEEYSGGTVPTDSDSDDDGLTDGDEVNTHGTDPLDSDSDDDGLTDGEEVNTYGTDPNDSDSDDDCLTDEEEVNTYGSDPSLVDGDSDGFCDVLEVSGGADPDDALSTPDTLRVSFQPSGSSRPDSYAPADSAAYRADLGYGWIE